MSTFGSRRESKLSMFGPVRKEDSRMNASSKEGGGRAGLKNRSSRPRRSGQVSSYVNPIFEPAGSSQNQAQLPSMSSAGDGGDQGGTGEGPTHPKSSGSGAIVFV